MAANRTAAKGTRSGRDGRSGAGRGGATRNRVNRLFAGYKPHRPQRDFHKSGKRFLNLAAGVRAGKTFAAAREAMKRIFQDQETKPEHIKGRALKYWIVAPTFDLTDVAQEEVFAILKYQPGDKAHKLVERWNASKRILVLRARTGRPRVILQFKSADNPERLVSVGLDGLWIDEAARCSEVAWANLRARIADRQGWVIFSTTPMGKNWYYQEVYRRGDPHDPAFDQDYANFVFRTVDNTAVPGLAAEVERARKQMSPRFFRRDFEASFESFAGQIYEEFLRATHVVPQVLVPSRDQFETVVIAKDWGFSPNPGVSLVIGITSTNHWWVLEEVYTPELLVTAVEPGDDCWLERDRQLAAKHGASYILADPSAPAYLTAYAQAGLPIVAADNDVAPGIQAVATLLHIHPDTGKPRLFISDRCSNLILELEGYHYKPNKDGTFKEQPEKVNDHTCDAMRYAVFTILGRTAAGQPQEVGVRTI